MFLEVELRLNGVLLAMLLLGLAGIYSSKHLMSMFLISVNGLSFLGL